MKATEQCFPVLLSRDGAVVRALASHQCGPGSIPGPSVICGLSLCWFSTLLRGFFSGYSGFPPSAKKDKHLIRAGCQLAVRPGFDSRTQRHMWAEFVLVLDPAPRVFLRVLRFSSLSKNRHTAYSSWLLAVLQGHAWIVQRLPEAPIHAFGPTLSRCVLAVLARAISETVIIIIIIIIIIITIIIIIIIIIMLYQMVLTFESVDEILKCDHSNQSY